MRRILYITAVFLALTAIFITGCSDDKDYINTFEHNNNIFRPEDLFDNEIIATDKESIYSFDESSFSIVESSSNFEIDSVPAIDEFIKEDNNSVIIEDEIYLEPESYSQSSNVWIPSSGKKYHKSSDCSNMKTPSNVTLAKAQSLGYEPCKRCYK